MDDTRYVQTIIACCLEPDFEILNAGDLTEIGEKGINLSGGQKARISLARAVYANKDIILMDDPISALDAKVRRKIFKRVFKTMLKTKTRILATHALDFLQEADRIIFLKNGKVEVQGTYDEVSENPNIKEILAIHNKNESEKQDAFTVHAGTQLHIPHEGCDSSNSEAEETLEMATKIPSKSLNDLTDDIVKKKMDKYEGKHKGACHDDCSECSNSSCDEDILEAEGCMNKVSSW